MAICLKSHIFKVFFENQRKEEKINFQVRK